MKKLIILLLTALMLISLAACESSPAKSTESRPATENTEATAATEKPTVKETEKATEKAAEKATDPPPETQPPETEKPKTGKENWRELYAEQIDSLDPGQYAGFALIFIDGDDVPELYAAPMSHVVTGHVYWVNDDAIHSADVSYNGLSYIERENLFLNASGWTGKGYDAVYSISGDQAETVASGEFCTVKGSEYYRWEGEDMSEADYQSAKNYVFDSGRASTPTDLSDSGEIKYEIDNY